MIEEIENGNSKLVIEISNQKRALKGRDQYSPGQRPGDKNERK